MSAAADAAQTLRALLTKLESTVAPAERAPAGPSLDGAGPAMHLLLYSFMLWESDPASAGRALARLYEHIIDPNELRVALPEEIAEWAGIGDDHALERAARVRACLNDIYRREHAVSLDRLAAVSKREAREYLDSLEGMTPYVAARVALLGFGGHAMPLDRRLAQLLEARGALEPGMDLGEAERWLERQVRASESERVVLLLDAWRERSAKVRGGVSPATGKRGSGPAKKGAGKRASGGPAARAPTSKTRPAGRSAPKRPKKDS